MSTTFKAFLASYCTPSWLLQPKGAALIQAMGDSMDELVVRVKDGVKARFPAYSPRDGLGAIATERGLPRGASETDASWADRLQNAFDLWYWAGSPTGILRALYTAGYAPQLVIGQGLEYELDVATGLALTVNNWGGPFNLTGLGTSFWSAFILRFPTSRWPASWTGAGHPPDVTSDEAVNIMRTVRRWRPAYATFARVIFGDSAVWGMGSGASSQWGASRTWGGGSFWSWTPSGF